MKTSLPALLICSLLLGTSCHSPSRTTVMVTKQPAKMPPGQAKKRYGEQSAREFAPGQQKKKNSTTVFVRN